MSLQRSDLILEVSGTLDANGAYVTDWFDSSGINSIRVATSSGGWQVEQSTDTVNTLGPLGGNAGNGVQATTDVSQFHIAARYFRLHIAQGSGWANQSFAVSVRRAS